MNRLSLDSSLLASATYFPARRLLELEFRDGAIYHFFDVPPACFAELLTSESKGKYFNYKIRKCFRYQLLAALER